MDIFGESDVDFYFAGQGRHDYDYDLLPRGWDAILSSPGGNSGSQDTVVTAPAAQPSPASSDASLMCTEEMMSDDDEGPSDTDVIEEGVAVELVKEGPVQQRRAKDARPRKKPLDVTICTRLQMVRLMSRLNESMDAPSGRCGAERLVLGGVK